MAIDLMALIGKAKPSLSKGGVGSGSPGDVGGGDSEREYAMEAFSALKDDDQEGFASALTSMVKACVEKSKGGEYEPDADDTEA